GIVAHHHQLDRELDPPRAPRLDLFRLVPRTCGEDRDAGRGEANVLGGLQHRAEHHPVGGCLRERRPGHGTAPWPTTATRWRPCGPLPSGAASTSATARSRPCASTP